MKKQSWSIIILCFNEEESLKRIFASVQKVIHSLSNPQKEIILVDDGSSDQSPQIIESLKRKYKYVQAIYHPKNLGIGMALRSGYAKAKFENICALPGDGQFDPRELIPFSVVEENSFVSFFRKKQESYSLFRLLLSRFNRWVNRAFLSIDLLDVNWVKIYKRKSIQNLNLKLHSSLVESEICAKLIILNNRCVQTPSVYQQRQGGKPGGASFKIIRKALLELIKLILILREFKNQLRIVSLRGSGTRK